MRTLSLGLGDIQAPATTLDEIFHYLNQADKSGIPDDAVSTVIPGAVIYIPFAELVDIDKEIERLNKEKDKLHKEIARCNGMLNNEKFTSKAPQAKIDEEKAKLEKYSDMLAQVEERLKTLSK